MCVDVHLCLCLCLPVCAPEETAGSKQAHTVAAVVHLACGASKQEFKHAVCATTLLSGMRALRSAVLCTQSNAPGREISTPASDSHTHNKKQNKSMRTHTHTHTHTHAHTHTHTHTRKDGKGKSIPFQECVGTVLKVRGKATNLGVRWCLHSIGCWSNSTGFRS